MADPKLSIDVTLNDKKAVSSLKKLTKDFQRNAVAINQSLEIVGKAYDAVVGGVGIAVRAVGEWIALTQVQERAERRIRSALDLRGAATGQVFEDIQRFNSAIQNSIGIGDEQLLQLQGTLLAMGVQSGALEEATRATIGLAEATGQNLNGAARIAARALNGEVAALTRYGISATDAADATEQLNALFGLAEAQANTLESQTRVLDAAWGDMLEELGRTFTESEEAKLALRDLSQLVIELGGFVAQNAGKITGFFDSTVRFVRDIAATGSTAAFALSATVGQLVPLIGLPLSAAGVGLDALERTLNRVARRSAEVASLTFNFAEDARRQARSFSVLEDALGPAGGERAKARASTTSAKRGPDGSAFGPSRAEFEAGERLQREASLRRAEMLATADEAEREFRVEQAQWRSALEEQQFSESQSRRLEDEANQQMSLDRQRQQIGRFASLATPLIQGFAGAMSQAFVGAIVNGENFAAAFKRAIGTAIIGMGTQLVQAGIMATILGGVSTAIPALAPFFGGPAALAAGAIATGAGLGMIALGASFGGGSVGAAGGTTNAGGASAPPAATSVPDFFSGASGVPGGPRFNDEPAGQTTTVNVAFNNVLPGGERRLGQEVLRVIEQAQSLNFQRAT